MFWIDYKIDLAIWDFDKISLNSPTTCSFFKFDNYAIDIVTIFIFILFIINIIIFLYILKVKKD